MVDMDTTVQISKELLAKLAIMKMHEKESYESVIWDLIEDRMEFSEQTKKNLAEAEEDIKHGRVHKWEDVVKELKINVSNNSFR
jgi:predicted transcriptional regulator